MEMIVFTAQNSSIHFIYSFIQQMVIEQDDDIILKSLARCQVP